MKPLSTPPLVAALLAASLQAHAYQAVPNAGTILQQQQPARPPAPQPGRPALQIDAASATNLPASQPFALKAIRIVGNTAFSTEVLHALVASAEGSTVTLPQLEQLAARITAYYRERGYPLSRAVVPAQSIQAGQVVIQVVEANYGAIKLDNSSQVGNPLLVAILAGLQPGQPIAGDPLDRALLLLSDVPGVAVQALIKPGAAVGAADFTVATRAAPTTFANLTLDNGGNRYIGRMRLGTTLYVTNGLHRGDVLDASVLSTFRGMTYGRLGYETLLSGQGTRAGIAYSRVHYDLHGEVESLDPYGMAGVSSAWVKQALLRSREANLYAQFQYDAKRLRDHIGVLDVRTDRHLDNWVLSLNGDLREELLGGAVNAWSLGWTRGRTGFDDSAAAQLDAATARTRGSFSKWNANASRLQRLGARDTLFLNLGVQWANANLDSAEKMTVGGPYSVRAYDIGAVSGDTGYIASAELRHDLGQLGVGALQASAFIDSARVTINHDTWTAGTNHARLSGAGVGLAWNGPDAWRANLSLATPIGNAPVIVGAQSSVRAWMTVSKGF
ncbi:ShlB/FhaC/HecB family hemolysin secretion/activation protein [Massilia sp. S19_KUP03_FR1]|uniref:ShlB/FhaC/HecB family hemolysin secretion/activation protein n=1 Tax=Massilia sp. S19_KUP03_FR1 TaxID=3025503 RepID=UPI002FCD83DC